MYEFTDKEIRSKFKKTQYGKKTNKWLYVSIIIACVFFIAYIYLEFFNGFETLKFNNYGIRCFYTLLFIAAIVACYFDGKRDGAIEEFKHNIKK